MKHNIYMLMLALVMGLGFVSCDEWYKVEKTLQSRSTGLAFASHLMKE